MILSFSANPCGKAPSRPAEFGAIDVRNRPNQSQVSQDRHMSDKLAPTADQTRRVLAPDSTRLAKPLLGTDHIHDFRRAWYISTIKYRKLCLATVIQGQWTR
jgi:hypothetical protein